MTTGVVLAVAMAMAAPAVAGTQTPIRPSTEQQRRQEKISIMEGTLTASVSVAAQRVAKDVKSINPTAMLFTGDASAKGFMLEGHGVFFYVVVPTLDLNVMISVDQLERSMQQRAEQQQRGDARQVNNVSPDAAQAPPTATDAAQGARTAAESLARMGAEGQKYRATVRLALIDAMLDNSKNLELQPDEWLTIAARGNEETLTANEILNLTTTVLRVKGSDLADFLGGRLTKEEARQKVEVREF